MIVGLSRRTIEEQENTSMQIILQPDESIVNLQAIYDKAIAEAIELFIVSAYLTDWQAAQAITDKCEELAFIVGTDFGLTRKQACRNVLKWLPDQYKSDFLAADHLSGFHPKLILWKDKANQGYLLLGSSNLTQAAFSTNHEANVLLEISDLQYTSIKNWIYKIRQGCSPISEDWLEKYREATKPPKATNGKKKPLVSFELPSGAQINKAVTQRREQYKAFTEIEETLKDLIEKCASGVLSNENFYDRMMALWGRSSARLQGKGFEIVGKHGDWQDVCKAISTILTVSRTAAIPALDNVVRKEIDRLTKAHNPNRGAWMSEMLCLYFPDLYPVVAKPVRIWLQYNKYRSPRKASEGSRYIDLALKLRQAINQNKSSKSNEAQNLLELDHAIWQWYVEFQKRA
jgi:hypothetical protein